MRSQLQVQLSWLIELRLRQSYRYKATKILEPIVDTDTDTDTGGDTWVIYLDVSAGRIVLFKVSRDHHADRLYRQTDIYHHYHYDYYHRQLRC